MRKATSRKRTEEEEIELNMEDKEATTVEEVEVMVRDCLLYTSRCV